MAGAFPPPALLAYRLATRAASPVIPILLRQRVRSGREDAFRLNERLARRLPARADGRLVWCHGASVGETRLLLGLGERLLARHPDLCLLFTCQTQTGAALLAASDQLTCQRQMAPIDTPAIAGRFMAHWQPDLAVFAEGEIWPNLLETLRARETPTALINARMTARSLKGWARVPATARRLFGGFDVLLAADPGTAAGLETLTGRPVQVSGNLKSALPPPPAPAETIARFAGAFVGGRACLVAASTHPGEEAALVEAWQRLTPRPALILAPRHPERGDSLARWLEAAGHDPVQRSRQPDVVPPATSVLLADTMGEMGLWYRLADLVYLGGGHAEGVGGHNPLEPLQLGKPIVTGPRTHNFENLMAELAALGVVRVTSEAADALSQALEAGLRLGTQEWDQAGVARFLAGADAPMATTLAALDPLIDPADTP